MNYLLSRVLPSPQSILLSCRITFLPLLPRSPQKNTLPHALPTFVNQVMSTSDLDTLLAIFASRPSLPPHYLQHILAVHSGDISRACHYILNLSDHNHDFQTTPSSFTPGTPPLYGTSPHSQRPDIQPSRIDLSDTAQATRLIENIKDIVLPALKSELSGLKFPDLSGEAERERLKYSLSDLVLSSITLHPQHVRVVVTEEKDIHIIASDISIAVKVGQWSYRLRFPPLRDTGCANFEFTGVKADILLRVNEADTSMTVSRCACRINGLISLRANNARLSWFYNSLAAVLKNALRPSMEAGLTQGIRSGIEQQLDQWSSWIMGAM